jgi:uncharacterized protein YdiU (UPF0061 family)
MSFLTYLRTPRSVEALAVDTSMLNYPRRVLNSVFATVPVQPLSEPLRVISVSLPALSLLSSTPLSESDSELRANEIFLKLFTGSQELWSAHVGWGHCYWGTQFGNYAGQLGDGAAVLIGEGGTGFEVNLKGSGKTPFSRGFDGRKVIRSSIREFLCSEAMAGLGIPTTRAGSVIMSDTSRVLRDVNYTGRPIEEKCAVVSRIAKTFIRFGSFESESEEDSPSVRELIRFTWKTLLQPMTKDNESFMDIVIDRTACSVAEWQAVGFVHGVMNTDNMSIIGDTIDYGPYGFVETYDPHFVPNTSDKFGRYALSEQPRVAAWNLERLYSSLLFHLRGESLSDYGLNDMDDVEGLFFRKFKRYYDNKMRSKMGLIDQEDVSDELFESLRSELFELLDQSAVDYTSTFRAISKLSLENVNAKAEEIMQTFPSAERVVRLSSAGLRVNRADLPDIEQFAATRLPELEAVGIDMNTIKRWRHKLDRIDRFMNSDLSFREATLQRWVSFLARLAPLMTDKGRVVMGEVNPVYIPRQSLMQKAIDEVEQDREMREVDRLLKLLQAPYAYDPSMTMYESPDLENYGACLSCSS